MPLEPVGRLGVWNGRVRDSVYFSVIASECPEAKKRVHARLPPVEQEIELPAEGNYGWRVQLQTVTSTGELTGAPGGEAGEPCGEPQNEREEVDEFPKQPNERVLAAQLFDPVRPELLEPALSLGGREAFRCAPEACKRLALGELVDPHPLSCRVACERPFAALEMHARCRPASCRTLPLVAQRACSAVGSKPWGRSTWYAVQTITTGVRIQMRMRTAPLPANSYPPARLGASREMP